MNKIIDIFNVRKTEHYVMFTVKVEYAAVKRWLRKDIKAYTGEVELYRELGGAMTNSNYLVDPSGVQKIFYLNPLVPAGPAIKVMANDMCIDEILGTYKSILDK